MSVKLCTSRIVTLYTLYILLVRIAYTLILSTNKQKQTLTVQTCVYFLLYNNTVFSSNYLQNGFYSSLPFIASIVSVIPAGIAADYFNERRWFSRTTNRKFFQITCRSYLFFKNINPFCFLNCNFIYVKQLMIIIASTRACNLKRLRLALTFRFGITLHYIGAETSGATLLAFNKTIVLCLHKT